MRRLVDLCALMVKWGSRRLGSGEVSGYFPEFGGLWVKCVEEGGPLMVAVCGQAG